MITIYSARESDFSTLGLGVLHPTDGEIEETAGGAFELTLTHPVDDAMTWTLLQDGNIIKAPCAAREAPVLVMTDNVAAGTTQTVTRAIYKVKTYTGKRLRLRAKPSTSAKILGYYNVGTEVVRVSASGGWAQVVVCKDGASGYMSDERLQFVRNETETVTGGEEKVETTVKTEQTRDQLFRIDTVEKDVENNSVTVYAKHIFYDLKGLIIDGEYAPEKVPADTALSKMLSMLSGSHDFTFHCSVNAPISGEYTGMSIVKALLDPEIGIVPQTGARIIRDNFDVYITPDYLSDRGMEIRHKKNMLGATMKVDSSDAVTRIKPVGRDKDGNRLTISKNGGWVAGSNASSYPTPRDAEVEYDVKVGESDGNFKDNAAAMAELERLALQDLNGGASAPIVSLDVNFVLLQNTVEYAQYESLLHVFLYDTVSVLANFIGINAKTRANSYTFNPITARYESIKLGEITDVTQTVYGYDIAQGSVSGSRLIPATVDGNVFKNATIGVAKISVAAIDELTAKSIAAVAGAFGSITAGSIETDELYAGIAHLIELAADSVRAGQMSADRLAAALAEIIVLRAGLVTADTVETDELAAKIAEIIALRAEKITAENIQTDHLAAALAEFVALYAKVGDFDFAQAQNLLAGAMLLEHGYADTVNIKNLMVTNANMLSAVIGGLVLKSTDGKYYNVSVGTDGALNVEETTVTEGEIAAGQTSGGRGIVETTANIADLAAGTITGEQAILESILTQALTAGKITAGEALLASASIPTLYVTSMKALGGSIDLSANEAITSVVDAASNAQSAADMAMNAADMAAPYYGDTPPDAPIQEGRLWIDSGVQPPMLRRWKGLDMDASRDTAGSATGNPASLPETAVAISEMKVQIDAKQAGSGGVSLNNVRPISGANSIDLYVYAQETGQDSGTVYNAQLPSTCYGGYIDWTRGVYVQTHKYFELKIADMNNGENFPGWKFAPSDLEDCISPSYNSGVPGAMGSISNSVYANSNNSAVWVLFYQKVSVLNLTQSQIKAQYPDVTAQIVLPLIEPVEYPLSLPAIAPLTGQTTLIYSEQASSISTSYLISGWDTVSDQTLLKADVDTMRSVIRQLTDEISLSVQKGELETFLRLVSEGVYIGKSDSMYRVFVDDAGVHIQQDGADIAVFAKRTLISPYLRAGDPGAPSVLAWTKTASGGMALVKMEAVV